MVRPSVDPSTFSIMAPTSMLPELNLCINKEQV